MNHEARVMEKITDFTDLNAWKMGHEFVLGVYGLTASFPSDERFGLVSQMRRAAVSITSNIAEGFSRRSAADKKHFYVMAHGSLTELQNQLIISRDVELLAEEDFKGYYEQSITVHKLLTGLIKATEQRS